VHTPIVRIGKITCILSY